MFIENIIISPITKELNDASASFIKGILMEEYPETYEKCIGNDLSDLSEFYSKNGKLLLALCQERIVGTIGAVHKKDYSLIVRLYVHKDFRRNGLGSRLIQEILSDFKEKNSIYVNVLKDMTQAIPFFEKHDFSFVPHPEDENVLIGIKNINNQR